MEKQLSEGKLDTDAIIRISERFKQVSEELDEKEMRWLELSEC